MVVRVIAIDGPAGAGKSTIARALAARLGLQYLDTGAMYRAVTFAAMRRDLPLGDIAAIGRLAREASLEVSERGVLVEGSDVTAAIRTPEVTAAVSRVAANSEVRAEMRARQQQWAAAHGGGVIEGRDIGSVVFPDAELKLYLTASPRTRAQRRVAEAGGDVDEIEAAIAARDHHDSNRADSPLTRADGSIVVDTTGSSIDEVLARIEVLISKGPAHQ
ncbi:MAG: (d)CMP kinase [Ilumatobacteraceae bacterium]|nr:(d)CMP kinase [Ilumatobacteraceae bacterium]MBP7890988.1 (d)CMP kinase [Ilumatobacteraceae bacterium]MBP9052054.1 (d)CMP kinase [Ilumatobacteraceae bacterium]HAN35926.1 (d)CMP kinase [Acidimicrobiaceae bacterium]